MLTESEVSRSWRALVGKGEMTPDVVEKCEALLEELRPESPLRHRLVTELSELQSRWQSLQAPEKPKGKGRKKVVAS